MGVEGLCQLCHGRRHRRTSDGWVRCACLTPLLDESFILPQLRPNGATTYPDTYDDEPAWPLEDRILIAYTNNRRAWANSLLTSKAPQTPATFEDFQYRAWRSLVPHRDSGLVYDAMDSYRVKVINFEQDKIYDSLLDLRDLDLWILFLGLADVPNKHLSHYIVQVLKNRQLVSRPTWLWCPMALTQIADQYSAELRDLLADMHAA